jgi:hypothetical protein
MGPNVGQEGHVTSALESDAQGALVPGARARLAPWLYLGALREVAPEPRHIFVVYCLYVVHAEGANLASRNIAVAAATPTGASGPSAAGAISTAGPGAPTASRAEAAATAGAITATAAGARRVTALLGCAGSGLLPTLGRLRGRSLLFGGSAGIISCILI